MVSGLYRLIRILLRITSLEMMSFVNNTKEVLRLLKDAEGYISGERVARGLNISRAAVWKQICKLRKEGFCIDAQSRLGYHLVIPPDKLIPLEIKDGIKTSFVGQEIFYYPKTESTNLIAKNLAINEAKEGTVVTAEEQTKGRGRLDRSWLSPAYKNILMSIIFRPDVRPSQVFSLTMLTSLAVVKAIKAITTLNALIKWPNDIYIGGKKIGGILTEFSAEHDRVNFVIVGVGLNVNFDPSIYPEIKDTATSLSKALGKEISRVVLLRSILEETEKGYNLLKKGKVTQIRNEWNAHSLITGKPVRIASFGITEEGVAESVDEDGCLILLDYKGKRKRIFSGDVSLKIDR
ncbi:MAG: biotin--[acetyl-CoA-carboxylase] ligase [Thermodesulfobacteriota bacterium]